MKNYVVNYCKEIPSGELVEVQKKTVKEDACIVKRIFMTLCGDIDFQCVFDAYCKSGVTPPTPEGVKFDMEYLESSLIYGVWKLYYAIKEDASRGHVVRHGTWLLLYSPQRDSQESKDEGEGTIRITVLYLLYGEEFTLRDSILK